MITDSSLSIILKKVKEGTLTEEEAEIIINDIKKTNWYPYWPTTITYDTGFQQPAKKYEITCSKTE
jgi:hypothetical protein